MIVIAYTVIGLALGCVPFAYLLAKSRLRVDVRDFGPDKNPGAANAWRAGGWRFGVAGGVLDWAKGFLPVFLAQYVSGLSRWALIPIALAPVLGHAFTPFFRFKGGKALASSFGMWAGLTHGFGFLAFAVTCGVFWGIQKVDAWATILGVFGLLAYLLILNPAPHLLALWAIDGALVSWKHARELKQPLELRSFNFR